MDLYDQIAAEYDEITGESARAGQAEAFLRELGRRFPLARVLDVACGTGLHAVMLAGMGVAVTGADISEAMLERARARAAAGGVSVRWVQAPMQEIVRHVEGPFDAVLCLGNSLPHLLEAAELDEAIAGFAGLLAPRGAVVLQLLNYSAVLSRRERIVGITRRGDSEFVRLYDFDAPGGLIRFNVLTIRWEGQAGGGDLASTMLRPYRWAELEAALRRGGLGRTDCYAGLAFQPFDEGQPDTLLMVARRG